MEETSADIFKMKLGHLKFGDIARVKLVYIMELPIEDKATKLTIPTTVAPRFIPPSDGSFAAKEIAKIGYKSSFDPKTPLHIKIKVTMKGQIKSIRSPSHHGFDITIEDGPYVPGQYRAIVESKKGKTIGDMSRDLVVFFDVKDNDQPRVFVEKSDVSTAVMVSLVPSFKLDVQKTEAIFLVDQSGSMSGGGRMMMVRKALPLFLHSLPSDCRFNIVSFGTRFQYLFGEKSIDYNDRTLERAKDYVEKMTASYGGTEVYHPLESILSQTPIAGYARQIFLLTDGSVSNADQVIRLVKRYNDSARVFTLGLGDSASRHLVKGVARAGKGTSLFSNSNEDLRPKVVALLRNATARSLTDVKILWNETDKKEPKTKTREATPKEPRRSLLGFSTSRLQNDPIVSDDIGSSKVLFDGTRMLDFKLFDDKDDIPAKVDVVALAPHGPLRLSIPISEDDVLGGRERFVHQMAARRKIQEIEETVSFMEYEDDYDGDRAESAKKFITHLGLQFGLATQYTSFIGVDNNSRTTTTFEGVMQSRRIEQEHDNIMWDCATSHTDGGGGLSAYQDDGIRRVLEDDGIPTEINELECGPTPVRENEPKNIADFQLANGSFKIDPALLKLLFLDEQSLKEYCPNGTELDVWLTAVCLAFIETTNETEKTLLSLVKAKAKKYLVGTCDNEEYIMEKAMELIDMCKVTLTDF